MHFISDMGIGALKTKGGKQAYGVSERITVLNNFKNKHADKGMKDAFILVYQKQL